MSINNKDDMIKENNFTDEAMKEQMAELLYKLEMGCSKVEQSAFDSINTTDQVMMGLKDIMEMLNCIRETQNEVQQAMDSEATESKTEQTVHLQKLIHQQFEQMEEMENELHKVVANAMEANDAARCIEAGVAEQSLNLNDFVQCNEFEL